MVKTVRSARDRSRCAVGAHLGRENDPSLPCDVDIYVVSPGAAVRPIAASPGRDASPDWSPDGGRIDLRQRSGRDLRGRLHEGPGRLIGHTHLDQRRFRAGLVSGWIAYFDGPLFGKGRQASLMPRRLIVAAADASDPVVLAGPSYAEQIAIDRNLEPNDQGLVMGTAGASTNAGTDPPPARMMTMSASVAPRSAAPDCRQPPNQGASPSAGIG